MQSIDACWAQRQDAEYVQKTTRRWNTHADNQDTRQEKEYIAETQ
jgi:hypothetical protein